MLTTGLVIGRGVPASVIEVNAKTPPVIGHAPVVSDVKFDNMTPAVNDKVTATPTITDADKDTLEPPRYQWQLDGVDISGATQDNYTLAPGQGNGKQLRVMVTPQTNPAITDPASGTAFLSSALITQGYAPDALDVYIYGTPEIGKLLGGDYRYYDSDKPSDREDTSSSGTRFEWICSRSGRKEILATTKTYTLRDVDLGCELSFNVTPRSQSGTPNTGAQAQSKIVTVTKPVPLPVIRIFNGNQIGGRSGSGFNMEIEYTPSYSTISSIFMQEHYGRPDKSHAGIEYKINNYTSSGSIITDNGNTIKFGNNAKSNKGDTVYFIITFRFQNGKKVITSSPRLILQ